MENKKLHRGDVLVSPRWMTSIVRSTQDNGTVYIVQPLFHYTIYSLDERMPLSRALEEYEKGMDVFNTKEDIVRLVLERLAVPDFNGVVAAVQNLRYVGYEWPELRIIERSFRENENW